MCQCPILGFFAPKLSTVFEWKKTGFEYGKVWNTTIKKHKTIWESRIMLLQESSKPLPQYAETWGAWPYFPGCPEPWQTNQINPRNVIDCWCCTHSGVAPIRWCSVLKETAIQERDMGASKNRGKTPQIIHFNRVFYCKPSILGVPLFL